MTKPKTVERRQDILAITKTSIESSRQLVFRWKAPSPQRSIEIPARMRAPRPPARNRPRNQFRGETRLLLRLWAITQLRYTRYLSQDADLNQIFGAVFAGFGAHKCQASTFNNSICVTVRAQNLSDHLVVPAQCDALRIGLQASHYCSHSKTDD